MSANRRVLTSSAALLAAASALPLAFIAAGCGGGAAEGVPAAATAPEGRGRVQVTVHWPERAEQGGAASRYIPVYAQSLYLELISRADGERRSLIVTRRDNKPETQTAAFQELLPVGDYVLAGAARTGDIGQGDDVAFGAVEVRVESGRTTDADLSLNSTITRMEATGPADGRAEVGSEVSVRAVAYDRNDRVLLDSLWGFQEAVRWEVISGPAGEFKSWGAFVPSAPGVVRLRATEPGAAKSAEVEVRAVGLASLRPTGSTTVDAGQSRILGVEGVADDGGVFRNVGELRWELVSGGDLLDLNGSGGISGKAPGTARVRATAPNGVSVEFDVTVIGYGSGVNVGVQ